MLSRARLHCSCHFNPLQPRRRRHRWRPSVVSLCCRILASARPIRSGNALRRDCSEHGRHRRGYGTRLALYRERFRDLQCQGRSHRHVGTRSRVGRVSRPARSRALHQFSGLRARGHGGCDGVVQHAASVDQRSPESRRIRSRPLITNKKGGPEGPPFCARLKACPTS